MDQEVQEKFIESQAFGEQQCGSFPEMEEKMDEDQNASFGGLTLSAGDNQDVEIEMDTDKVSPVNSPNSGESGVTRERNSSSSLPDDNDNHHAFNHNSSSGFLSTDELTIKPKDQTLDNIEHRIQIPTNVMFNEMEMDVSMDITEKTSEDSDDENESDHENDDKRIVRRRRRQKLPVSDVSTKKLRERVGGRVVNANSPTRELVPFSSPGRGRGRGGRGRGRGRGSLRGKGPSRMSKSDDKEDNVQPEYDIGDTEVNFQLGFVNQEESLSPAATDSPSSTRKSPRGGSRGGKNSSSKSTSRTTKKKMKETKNNSFKLAELHVHVFEEETRMSATSDDKPKLLLDGTKEDSRTDTDLGTSDHKINEESQQTNLSTSTINTPVVKKPKKIVSKEAIKEKRPITAENLREYQWPLPPNDDAEFYFVQEQVSEYLDVKSFKRKYPNIQRRKIVNILERDYLLESHFVAQTDADLGLTAVLSTDVFDIMAKDFPEKYNQLMKVYQQRKAEEMAKSLSKSKAAAEIEKEEMKNLTESMRKRLMNSCATWNAANNKKRMEDRSAYYDLQTNCFQYPKHKFKVRSSESTKTGAYPVPLLPGHYTDDFKSYTPNELFYLPLDTVKYGPVKENLEMNELKKDCSSSSSSDSESSDSDSSDSSSSSDEDAADSNNAEKTTLSTSTSESTKETVLTDAKGNVLYRGVTGLTKVGVDDEVKCRTCGRGSSVNKNGKAELFIYCTRCNAANHPTCLELSLDMLPFITKYKWECTQCKCCLQCNDRVDEDKMLFCDCCDRSYHIYCIGLRKVPTSRWHCSFCARCHSCGTKQPSVDDKTSEWYHEYRKTENEVRSFLRSYCVDCYKLRRKGQVCSTCGKTYSKLDVENKILMECRKCEKYFHKSCVKQQPEKSMLGIMCDPCGAAFRLANRLPSLDT